MIHTTTDSSTSGLFRLLDTAGLLDRLGETALVLIKPNLVEARLPPITTPVDLVEGVVVYLQRRRPQCRIVVGEGTGSVRYATEHCFAKLGYRRMAERRGITLLDLNTAPLQRLVDRKLVRLPEIYLPEILAEAFLLSVPVLKAHSMAGVTLTMKNMLGCVPPAHYRVGNSWGKSAFHADLDQAIYALNSYRHADFSLLDATVGMAEAHLWGPTCQPAPGILAAGSDPVALDSYGAGLLGRAWAGIGHIRLAHGQLGQAEPLAVVAG
jgi:uncharacterized protein (DUF362 family)